MVERMGAYDQRGVVNPRGNYQLVASWLLVNLKHYRNGQCQVMGIPLLVITFLTSQTIGEFSYDVT